jgi:hypothetical protein
MVLVTLHHVLSLSNKCLSLFGSICLNKKLFISNEIDNIFIVMI